MSRTLAIKFALSLVAVLILGQLQCVAACVSFFSSQAANASLPPCHRHHDSKHSSDSSGDCAHDISAAGIGAPAASTAAPQLATIATATLPQLTSTRLAEAALILAAPPGFSAPAVLRI